MHGTEWDGFTTHLRGNKRRPTVAHFVPDLRHRIVVGKHRSVRRHFSELVRVEGYIALRSHRRPLGRIFLHLVGADVYGLYELPLEPALAAVVLKALLCRSDPSHVAA